MTSGVPQGRNREVTGSNPVEVRIFSGFSSISKIASITARIIAYLTTVVIIMQICDVLRGCAPCCVCDSIAHNCIGQCHKAYHCKTFHLIENLILTFASLGGWLVESFTEI